MGGYRLGRRCFTAGAYGLEIVATLFLLKLLHPASLYMIRGNHECTDVGLLLPPCASDPAAADAACPGHIHLLSSLLIWCWCWYCMQITILFGFCGECQRRSNLEVWEAVMKAFDALPLAAVIGGSVLCVHGGLSPQLESLAQINGEGRFLDVFVQ